MLLRYPEYQIRSTNELITKCCNIYIPVKPEMSNEMTCICRHVCLCAGAVENEVNDYTGVSKIVMLFSPSPSPSPLPSSVS